MSDCVANIEFVLQGWAGVAKGTLKSVFVCYIKNNT